MVDRIVAGVAGGVVALVVLVALYFSDDDTSKKEPPSPSRSESASGGVAATQGWRNNRSRRVLLTVFGVFIVFLLEVIALVDGELLWLWFIGVLPALLVVHHGIQLAVFKNRRFFDSSREPSMRQTDPATISIVRAAMKEERQYYGSASLALRFALPAIVLVISNLVIGHSLAKPPEWGSYIPDERFFAGAQAAALGAYCYVLLLLGARTLRGDITPSSVWWSTVTMTVGPLLGGALSMMFVADDLSLLVAAKDDASKGDWSPLLLPFAAGFTLRYIVSFLHELIRRVIVGRPLASVRTVPLTQLRGIDQEIEDRLAEEGIIDVSGLAMANPTKLRRNTRFDKRQLLSWIDEALLVLFFPTTWQSLENDGVTGAIDLIWYACDLKREHLYIEEEKRTPDTKLRFEKIADLAKRNKLLEASLLDTMFRMKEDAQVSLIRGLYQLDDTESEESGDPSFRSYRAEFVSSPRGEPRRYGQSSPELAARSMAPAAVPEPPFLLHKWRPCPRTPHYFDVMITVRRKGPRVPGEPAILSVEYTLGSDVSPVPILKTSAKDDFRLDVTLDRSRLCAAEVVLGDGSKLQLERYLDVGDSEQATA